MVDDDGEPWIELWVVDPRDGTPRPYVTGKVNVSNVRWSLDGQQLAFIAKRADDKFKALYLIPVDGGEARKATELGADISGFSLAPDGRRVALVASQPEPESKKKLEEKGFKQEIYEEDGRPARIWLSTLFEKKTNSIPLPIDGHIVAVHWSPSDDRLLVAVTPTSTVDDSMMRQQVWVVEGATGAVVGRIEREGKLGDIGWSPDGSRIALIGAADIHDPQSGRLMIADATGGAARDVLPDLEGHVTHFEWADRQTLVYVAGVGVKTIVSRVNVLSGEKDSQPLLGPEGPIVTGLSISQGRQLAVVGSLSSHPPELFTWNEGDSAPNRRTHSNPGLDKLKLGRQEVIRHKARDGIELEGILIHPINEVTGQRYPLILAVHGGPESHVSDGWNTTYSLPGQVAAARGMSVFYPNYRGSTGRGVAFSKMGQGDAAGKEFDDLVDAVDHLIASGLVDSAKVGITGGSYGGYATAWCSTRYSDRFAAGVMFVGISDKVSKLGTTDIADEEYQVHALKRPWEDWNFLLERSPIFHAAKGRTPLLILHGKDDPRVNVGQSRELYRHLKIHNKAPVRLVLYPGEVHGNRKAAARLDYNLRMMQWMEHYLKGPSGNMPALEIDYSEPK